MIYFSNIKDSKGKNKQTRSLRIHKNGSQLLMLETRKIEFDIFGENKLPSFDSRNFMNGAYFPKFSSFTSGFAIS